MAQMIADFNTFLNDAKAAVNELKELIKQEEQVRQQERCLEKELDGEKKAVADAISLTVKKRREEISDSYDKEIGKIQEKLKKVIGKREKAKSQGVRERIKEETEELYSYNRELNVRMKTLFQQERVPGICRRGLYYALYFPRGIKEFFILFVVFLCCFLVVPYGIYSIIPEKRTFYLVVIYFFTIFVFGGIYTVIGNTTRGRHLEALKEGRLIRNLIRSNHKKIKVITSMIKKDKNETIYNLEKYDDEIAQLDQDLAETVKKKQDALNTFENVKKTIISDEIMGNSQEKIDKLREEHDQATKQLRQIEARVKEKKIYITDTYESYVGREFLNEERLEQLRRIIESGKADNISEAIDVYRELSKK